MVTMWMAIVCWLVFCGLVIPSGYSLQWLSAIKLVRSRVPVKSTPWRDVSKLLDTSNNTQTLLNLVQYGQSWQSKQLLSNTSPKIDPWAPKEGFVRVPGCMSNVRLRVDLLDAATGHVEIQGEADSKLATGMLALVINAIERYGDKLSSFLNLDLQAVLQEGVSVADEVLQEDYKALSTLYKILPHGRMNGFLNIAKLIQQQLRSQSGQPQLLQSTDLEESTEDFLSAARNSTRREEIAVLLSGGVDSSVTLALLNLIFPGKVRAYYLKIWLDDEIAHLNECPWEEDIAYAQATCQALGVPLHVLSLQKEYREHVVEYTLNEARAGRTPNPDIMCNSRIKFGMFYDYIGQYHKCIATGHYAQSSSMDEVDNTLQHQLQAGIAALLPTLGLNHSLQDMHAMQIPTDALRNKWRYSLETLSNQTLLGTSPDAIKDQSYFLSNLKQYQLAQSLFPIGQFPKTVVRSLADKLHLPTKDRKDSQGICFLGKLKFDDFLQYYLGESEGEIRDYVTQEVMGRHRGLWFHTIGQRKGLGLQLFPGYIHLGPWFVAAKDIPRNILYATNNLTVVDSPRLNFDVVNVNWFLGVPPVLLYDAAVVSGTGAVEVMVKLRHGPTLVPARITALPTECQDEQIGTRLRVQLLQKDKGIAPGQFAAFYEGDVCLGAGMIAETLPDEREIM